VRAESPLQGATVATVVFINPPCDQAPVRQAGLIVRLPNR